MFLRIVAPHFVAGVEFDERVHNCAPILRYMKGWGLEKVYEYCTKKEWKVEECDEKGNLI